MNELFKNCSSLPFIPDISKWDLRNVIGMNSLFDGCTSLIDIPDISKWKLNSNVIKEDIFPSKSNSDDSSNLLLNISSQISKISNSEEYSNLIKSNEKKYITVNNDNYNIIKSDEYFKESEEYNDYYNNFYN